MAIKLLILLLEKGAAQCNVKAVYCDSGKYIAGVVVKFRLRILTNCRNKLSQFDSN